MRRLTIRTALIGGAIALLLAGCAAEPGTTAPAVEPPASSDNDMNTTEPEKTDSGTDSGTTTMPPGARPASDEFPFPVPEGWREIAPFTEEKIGKKLAMTALYEFPGDAESAAATYKALLDSAGYSLQPNLIGEVVHDATFIVEGPVAGTRYSGGIDFDTMADGVQTAVIHLVK